MKEINEDIEAMGQIFCEAGVALPTDEVMKQICTDYNLHLEMMQEMQSYQFVGGSQECEKCKSLKKEIKTLDKYRSDCEEYIADSHGLETRSLIFGNRHGKLELQRIK